MQARLTFVGDILIVIFCVAGFYHVFEKAGLPVVFVHNSLIVEQVTQDSSCFNVNDNLTAIDGTPLASIDQVEFYLDSKSVGQLVTVSLERNHQPLTRTLPLVRYFSARYLAVQLIVASIFIFLALFVSVKRKDDRAAQIFNWVTMSTALIISATWGKMTIEPNGLGHVVRAAFHLAYASAGVLFVHFTLVFPSARYVRTLRALRVCYVAALAFAAAATVLFLEAARDFNEARFELYNNVFNLMRLFCVVCIATGLFIIIHTYLTAQEEPERRKLRWILAGLALGPFSFIALWVIPQIFTSRGLLNEEFIVLLMLSVPVTFAIAIVKYHILNIDQIFKRGTVYVIAFSAVLAIYVGVVSLSPLLMGTLTVTSSLAVSTVAAVIIAVLFQPIRSRTQNFVDKVFFNVRYDYREAEKKFNEVIAQCYDESSIVTALTCSIDTLIPNSETRVLMENEKLTALLNGHREPAALSESIEFGAKFFVVDRWQFNVQDAAIAFRIHSERNGTLGVLLLGPKKSGFRYTLEDIDLLDSFCRQVASVLDRVRLHHTLINEQLEKDRLKQLNELKSYFVSSVTHELKTPLTSIKLFTELIEETPKLKPEQRSEYLGIIKGESERLTRLIDNVLDISKIEKGVKEYRFARIALNDCVKEALATMRFQLALHGFDCRTKLSTKKLMICADKDAVMEIVINLISNAIKYSSQRKRIIVTTSKCDGGCRLDVQDFGIGIAPEDRERIFAPFERAGSDIVRRTAGAGLGLALVKHITAAHHARVDLASKPGAGSTFTVTFPSITSSAEKP
ncbi:MAG TPA: ATP-binding protein [Bacteroidota bacterium]|nr:ATP-binding protein [Bacteroidota bacterium]